MPQMRKGGKFIYGKSLIHKGGSLRFPARAAEEYDIASEGFIYMFTGSKSTGGFCVTRKGLLLASPLGRILTDNPELLNHLCAPGEFVKYKGRSYAWTRISAQAEIELSQPTRSFLELQSGMELLCIRSSNIAFTMGAYGPLIEESQKHQNEILCY